ncbi:MAG: 3-phosphoglycerate dehydrogenase [Bacteroidetes bacterium]|nr:3-phosphoglycerate dehydrogenase [Bacteroidota bacterium]
MKILANDGIDAAGKRILEAAGFTVITDKIPQSELPAKISDYDVLIVRSATKVTAEVMDGGKLKLIARAGVGLDNIDLKHAGIKNIPVVNTPNASSRSVAELVFAHIFTLLRYLQVTNREMPEKGVENFNALKKLASGGAEVAGKRLGIIGFGRIGQEVARMAIGLGMEVLIYDYKQREFELTMLFHRSYQTKNFHLSLTGVTLDEVLGQSDIITIHTPGSAEVIGEEEINKMKHGVVLINCARGGVVNEKAMNKGLEDRRISAAGIDVFEQEPPVYTDFMSSSSVSLSPHIGASTSEAQERVGVELAERICAFIKR